MSDEDLPAPLTPADCDLRGMPYMPVDIVRLFDSDLYALATGEEFKAAFTLWGKAFLQCPAASLPADERILAHLSGVGANWKKVREMALRGWIKCSDGRLYHPVVAEKAREAWQARLDRRARTEAARAARQAARSGSDNPPSAATTEDVTEDVTNGVAGHVAASVTEIVTGSKGSTREREGKLSKKDSPPSATHSPPRGPKAARAPRSLSEHDPPGFAAWYARYPRHVGPDSARRAYAAALKRGVDPPALLQALEAQLAAGVFDGQARFVPHAATWLNGGRWRDDLPESSDAAVLRAVGLDPAQMRAPDGPGPEVAPLVRLAGGRAH